MFFAFESTENISRTIGGPYFVYSDLSTGEKLQAFTSEGTSMLVSASSENDLVAAGGLGGDF